MKFRIRASACGQIMTNPRKKTDLISKTAQTYCETWLKEKLYNRQHTFSSKYTEKGLLTENESIDFLAEYYDLCLLMKNDKQFSNEWITGEPDVIQPNLIIDVKNSWSPFTFPYFGTDVPDKSYYWQGQCYMDLTDTDEFWLIYVLSDTPQHLIEREMFSYARKMGMTDPDEAIWDHFMKDMTYSDVPDDLKIKRYIIKRDDKAIQSIHDRVELVRDYLTPYIELNQAYLK